MDTDAGNKKEAKKRSFFSRVFEKLDKKMKEKADKSCCCKPGDNKNGSCCS
ncbi:MAG: hypothetical protein PHE18_05745 [Candidatus Omnitrophica bacterium]|nr:hypothetical protein [Candidatus Omnitrophota bacterium]MDD5553360.1 hypothetical protein [Candidatus Omnitrophota bacterium]